MECFVLCIKATPKDIRQRLIDLLNRHPAFRQEFQESISLDGTSLDYDYEFLDLPDPTLATFVDKGRG